MRFLNLSLILLACGAGFAAQLLPPDAAGGSPELSVEAERPLILRAVLLEKLTRFVDWPADAGFAQEREAAFRLGVVGSDSLLWVVGRIYSARKILGHRVETVLIDSLSQLARCQMVVIGTASPWDAAQVLSAVGSQPVLLVGESPGSAARGFQLELGEEGNRLRYDANEASFLRARLHASFRLFLSARKVHAASPERP
jgi:hypothetical protein